MQDNRRSGINKDHVFLTQLNNEAFAVVLPDEIGFEQQLNAISGEYVLPNVWLGDMSLRNIGKVKYLLEKHYGSSDMLKEKYYDVMIHFTEEKLVMGEVFEIGNTKVTASLSPYAGASLSKHVRLVSGKVNTVSIDTADPKWWGHRFVSGTKLLVEQVSNCSIALFELASHEDCKIEVKSEPKSRSGELVQGILDHLNKTTVRNLSSNHARSIAYLRAKLLEKLM